MRGRASTPQILLASWRSTRFEVSQVLREVCDEVLGDRKVSDDILIKRAKVGERHQSCFHPSALAYLVIMQAIMMTGAIYKAVVADESDEERRQLER